MCFCLNFSNFSKSPDKHVYKLAIFVYVLRFGFLLTVTLIVLVIQMKVNRDNNNGLSKTPLRLF